MQFKSNTNKEKEIIQKPKSQKSRFSSNSSSSTSFTPNTSNTTSKTGSLGRSTSENSVFSAVPRGILQKKLVRIEQVDSDQIDGADCTLADHDAPDDEMDGNKSRKEQEKQTLHNEDFNEVGTQMGRMEDNLEEGDLLDGEVDLIGDESDGVDELHGEEDLQHGMPQKRSRSVSAPIRAALKRKPKAGHVAKESQIAPKRESEILRRLKQLEKMMEDKASDDEMDDDDQDEYDEGCDEDDDEEEDDDKDSDAEDDDEEDEVDNHPLQPTSSVPCSAKGKKAREIMTDHFGDLNKFQPMTHVLPKTKRDDIIKAVQATEAFYPPVREIERPFNFTKWNDKEKERKLYKQVCDMKQMYQLEMALVYHIANGDQELACKRAMQLVDVTLDTAANVNLERLALRSGATVVDYIRHVGEEPVYQQRYKDITSEKAKEARDLQTVAEVHSFQNKQRLRQWGPMRRGWEGRTARRQSRGRFKPSQSKSTPSGGYSKGTARHWSAGKWAPSKEQQAKKNDQPRQENKSKPVGSRKF
jgi:hypothetical protein